MNKRMTINRATSLKKINPSIYSKLNLGKRKENLYDILFLYSISISIFYFYISIFYILYSIFYFYYIMSRKKLDVEDF